MRFKAFILADAQESYVYNWRLYTGKEEGQRCTGLAQKVVLELVEGLQYKGHVIHIDNYYTSLPLIKELSIKMFGVNGMVRKNRKGIPEKLKKPPAKMNKGQSFIFKQHNTLALLYKDKRYVTLLTTVENYEKTGNKPFAIQQYNKWNR